MTSTEKTPPDSEASANNASSSSSNGIIGKLASIFAPAPLNEDTPFELPAHDPFDVKVYCSMNIFVITLTKENAKDFFLSLLNPSCVSIRNGVTWINKARIDCVEIVHDRESVPTPQNSVRSEQRRPLDKEAQTPQSPTIGYATNLTSSASVNEITRNNLFVPRGTSHVR